MKLAIDRYVLRTAVVSTVVCAAAFMGLYAVFDAFGRLDDFVRELEAWDAALRAMLRYYLLHLPVIFIHIAPFAVLMASLFTLARLDKHNEIVAVKACGISLRRLTAVLLGWAFFVSCLMYVDRQWVIPRLSEELEASERMILKKGRRKGILRNLFLRDLYGRWFVVGQYDPETLTCRNTWIIASVREERKIRHASKAVLTRTGFHVKRGTDLAEGPKPMVDVVIPTNLRAEDLIARAGHMRFRSYTHLLRILGRNPDARDVDVMFNRNLAFPLVVVIIPLIGMSVMFIRESAGTFCPVGIAILVCFMYFALDAACCEIARQGLLSPRTGVWTPISIFSAAGVYLFTRMRT